MKLPAETFEPLARSGLRTWRCATCWKRVVRHPTSDHYICEGGHVISGIVHARWSLEVLARFGERRNTGLVIGPSMRVDPAELDDLDWIRQRVS